MGKGEIARSEQFLLFPQCFKKRLASQGRQKVSLCGNGLKRMIVQCLVWSLKTNPRNSI